MSAALLALVLASAAPAVTEEGVVREFTMTCVANFTDLAGLKRAAAASPFGYSLRDPGTDYASRVWTSAGVSIDYYRGGAMSSRISPQCTVTADLKRAVDVRRLYDAVATIPGATPADASLSRWLRGQAWTLPGLKTVVVKTNASQSRRIILSLQPVAPMKGKR